MEDKLKAVGKETFELAWKLISNVSSQLATVSCGAEFITNVSNIIFVDKLSRVLAGDNKDFFEWLKIAESFDRNNDNYQDAVRQLIYTLNAINESKLLDVYANLLRAYKADCISKGDFFRLGWILSNIFSADLMYLPNCYGKAAMKECQELRRLEQRGLVYLSSSRAQYNAGVLNFYTIILKSNKTL